MKKQRYVWLAAVGFLLLSACGPKQSGQLADEPSPTGMGLVSPTESAPPEITQEPPTEEPEPTESITQVPTKEPNPTESVVPSPTKEPEPTESIAPSPTKEPEPTESIAPSPTKEPEPTESIVPSPTEEPEPTESIAPSPTKEPEPTESVVPSPTKEPEPMESIVPEPTKEPEPTESVLPEPTPEMTPTPVPTLTLEELLRNGWQKTGDITGNFDILFPKLFDCVEIIKNGQEAWIKYTSKDDDAIAFYIGYIMKRSMEEQKAYLLEEGAMFLSPAPEEIGQQYIVQDETTMYLGVVAEQQYGRELLGAAFGEEETVPGIMQVIFAFPKDKTEYTAEQYRIYIQSAAGNRE